MPKLLNDLQPLQNLVQNLQEQGEQTIKAIELVRQRGQLKEEAKKDPTSKNSQTINPLQNDVNQWFSNVERFCNIIGGREELEKFIRKLSDEGGTGEIYELQNKKKNQKQRKPNDYMPRNVHREESAYEIAYARYESHLKTIYFLLDLYEGKKKNFSKLLRQIEKNADTKAQIKSKGR